MCSFSIPYLCWERCLRRCAMRGQQSAERRRHGSPGHCRAAVIEGRGRRPPRAACGVKERERERKGMNKGKKKLGTALFEKVKVASGSCAALCCAAAFNSPLLADPLGARRRRRRRRRLNEKGAACMAAEGKGHARPQAHARRTAPRRLGTAPQWCLAACVRRFVPGSPRSLDERRNDSGQECCVHIRIYRSIVYSLVRLFDCCLFLFSLSLSPPTLSFSRALIVRKSGAAAFASAFAASHVPQARRSATPLWYIVSAHLRPDSDMLSLVIEPLHD